MSYPEFRNQLDAVLRTKDPEAVRRFLIEQGQWDEGSTNDVAHAMWMMIAGSPALQHLHAEAQNWLMQHGYQAEAEMLLERKKTASKPSSAASRPKGKPRPARPGAGSKPQPNQPPRPKNETKNQA
jgi:hypothetical protein